MKKILITILVLSASMAIILQAENRKLSTYDERLSCMKKECCRSYIKCSDNCYAPGKGADNAEINRYLDCMDACTNTLILCSAEKCSWTDDDTDLTFLGDNDPCSL